MRRLGLPTPHFNFVRKSTNETPKTPRNILKAQTTSPTTINN
jgi:hypothetical protein